MTHASESPETLSKPNVCAARKHCLAQALLSLLSLAFPAAAADAAAIAEATALFATAFGVLPANA